MSGGLNNKKITVDDFPNEVTFLIADDWSLATQKDVENHSALPDVRFLSDFLF
jgi:hypothetical protein